MVTLNIRKFAVLVLKYFFSPENWAEFCAVPREGFSFDMLLKYLLDVVDSREMIISWTYGHRALAYGATSIIEARSFKISLKNPSKYKLTRHCTSTATPKMTVPSRYHLRQITAFQT